MSILTSRSSTFGAALYAHAPLLPLNTPRYMEFRFYDRDSPEYATLQCTTFGVAVAREAPKYRNHSG